MVFEDVIDSIFVLFILEDLDLLNIEDEFRKVIDFFVCGKVLGNDGIFVEVF